MKRKHAGKKRPTNLKSKSKQLDEEIPSDSDEDNLIDSNVEPNDSDTYEKETAYEKKVRLTKQAIQKALKTGYPDSIICLKGHKKAVSCICIADDPNYIYSGGKDASIIKCGKRGSTYRYHTGPILSIAISNDGKYLASGSADQTVIVWNPDQMTVFTKLTQHKAPVTAVSFRRYSHMLFTADSSGRVCVWNMPLTDILQDQGARTHIEVLGLCGLTSERCLSCSGFGGPGICMWKVPDEVCVQYSTKNVFETSIECVYAVNDVIFIGGSVTNTLYIWHSSKGSPVFSVSPAHPIAKLLPPTPDNPFPKPVENWVSAITGLNGTDLLVTGSSTGHVQLWRLIQPSQNDCPINEEFGQSQPVNRTEVTLERLSKMSMSLASYYYPLECGKL